MPKKENPERMVTIKLKAWQIPYLIGAAHLGIYAEDWCAGLIMTGGNCFDTHSSKWIGKVGYILDQIKNQTRIKEEEMEYGYDEALIEINEMIGKKCDQNMNAWFEYEKELQKEGAEKR